MGPSTTRVLRPSRMLGWLLPVVGWIMAGGDDAAATEQFQVGAASFWTGKTINWTALGNGLNEPISGTGNQLDFVGNSSNPGLYYADQDGYVFFRMRVSVATFPLLTGGVVVNGAYVLGIDKDQNGSIDYGFSWDAKNGDSATHGLEMSILGTPNPILSTTTWSNVKMDDIDGGAGSKGIYDINGNSRTTDGYVRTTDSIAEVTTSALGTTTFIDFAVSWNYLSTDCKSTAGTLYGLGSDRIWNVSAATINNATDHGALDYDIMGAAPGDLVLSSGAWSGLPEPTNALVGLLVVAGLLRRRRG